MSTATQRACWWDGEDAVPLHAIPALLPARRPTEKRPTGKPVAVQTVYRWTTAGVCGVVLRRFRVGGRGWATTRQELLRWQAAVTAVAGEAVA